METNNEHINNLFKQKFEDFAPQPPERVWTGIVSALDTGGSPVWYYSTTVKITVVLLGVVLLLGGYWLLNNKQQPHKGQNDVVVYKNITKNSTIIDIESTKYIGEQKNTNKEATNNKHNVLNVDNPRKRNTVEEGKTVSVVPSESSNNSLKKSSVAVKQSKRLNSNQPHASLTENEKPQTLINNNAYSVGVRTDINRMQKKSVSLKNSVSVSLLTPNQLNDVSHPIVHNNHLGRWVLGFYFSPEFIFGSFDSLTIQNSYALKIEPTYYFNNHWFVRPGIGMSYARDKGFVKADYSSWDYLGSYEDVTGVTFDTIDGNLTPVYHTQTRDVYDSVLHITVSEEINRYLYLQTSLVFGYHNHVSKFGWSVYAGPQVNFIVAEKRDNPIAENATTVYMKYNLAERKSPQFGLKLGFGIDYVIAKKWLVTVEPEYNYFINGINGGDIYNKPLSGIGLHFGLIYTIN